MQETSFRTEDLIGSVLLGRYRIVRELAKGGMGVVYLARSEGAVGFVKPVVVKLVLPEHAEDERFVGMFAREARILAQLRHPSVVDVLEFGEEGGAYVLVLEYVRGHHVGQWMRYLSLKKRKAPPEILIQIVIDVLDALHHAHHQKHPDGTPMQIVHRDVSPSNILLDEDGRGRLLDFGVARMRGGANDYKTQVEGFMGKLPYTSPEIFSGSEASPQSDLYACGVVLHELLLGRNVFRNENQAATLNLVMRYAPEPLEPLVPGLPTGFDAVLAKALAKEPADRYETAQDFAQALRKLQREQESEIRSQLAALLKDDFGPEMASMLRIESLADRDEAWRKLSMRPPAPGSHEEPSAARPRRNTRNERSASGLTPGGLPHPPPPLDATVASSPGGARREGQITAPIFSPNVRPIAAPPPHVAPPPPPPPRATTPTHGHAAHPAPHAAPTSKLMLGAFALTLVVAIAAIVVALQATRATAPAAAPVTAVRIVEQPIEPVPQPVEAAPEPAPEPAATAEAEPTVEPPSEPPTQAQPSAPAKPRGPDPRELTRAFRRQQPKIEACFTQHVGSLEGKPSVQIEFDLDAKGGLSHAQVLPESVAATPLGKCLEQVARATTFPAQGEPVSFAIPVTASRGN